jgi:predicted  nucleic acid-binding Zn-ribbon protein
MFRWVVLKRRVGAVTSQRVLKVLFYVNILQCFFVVEHFTASFRLFKPVRSEPLHDNNKKFLHIPFANKGIYAINISNILNRKEVVKEIPPYFKNQSIARM